MESHVEPGAYKDAVLFLATAGVVVPLFRRWKISPILGFLGAGVLLGPYGLGRLAHEVPWLSAFTIDNPAEVAQLAEFGVVFLLFMIGLELSWERLRALRRYVFGLGALQVALCIAVTAGAAMAMGQPLGAAMAIGAALALSSTAIVMPILAEQKRQHSVAGRATFSVLLFQDLAVAPILVTTDPAGPAGRRADAVTGPAQGLRAGGGRHPAAAGNRAAGSAAAAALGGQGQERGAVCRRLPAGGDRGGPDQRPGRPLHGPGRLHRRTAASRDGIPPRGRGDH